MAGAQAMPIVVAEAGDRAVDGRLRDVVRADAEPRGDTGPEALEDDVGACAERRAKAASAGRSQTTDSLPARSAVSHAVAVGRIGSPPGGSTRTTRAPSRVSSRLAYAPGQVAREVDDERSRERLHAGGAYLYPRRR